MKTDPKPCVDYCDYCGTHAPCMHLYLDAKANRKPIKGFYPDLAFSLCGSCLELLRTTLADSPEKLSPRRPDLNDCDISVQ